MSFYCEAKGGVNEGTLRCPPPEQDGGGTFDGIRWTGGEKRADKDAGGATARQLGPLS